ncbi:MAG: hypothetical protein IPI57_13560 [Candidatus Competibacteraceae bacterium]|nr:hypothetical protein [Candidatus Competibacteraceae bacterium]
MRVKTLVRRFQPADLSAILLSGQRVSAFDEMEKALEKPFLLDGLAELAGEVRDRLRRQPLDLFLNANHPLIQAFARNDRSGCTHHRPILTGLLRALLNAQHRLTPAVARRFHADLQALLGDYLALQIRRNA